MPKNIAQLLLVAEIEPPKVGAKVYKIPEISRKCWFWVLRFWMDPRIRGEGGKSRETITR